MQAPDDAMNGARKAAKRRSLLAMRRLHDIVALHRRGRALHAQPVVAVVATEDAPRLPQGIDAQRDDGETFLAIMAMPVAKAWLHSVEAVGGKPTQPPDESGSNGKHLPSATADLSKWTTPADDAMDVAVVAAGGILAMRLTARD